jgi:DNA polymerase III subunit epsilon
MKGGMEGGGCFRTGLHYPGIAHLIRVSVQGLSSEWPPDHPIASARWASIDTETTGRSATEDRVVEVGIAFFERGQLVDEKGWLIQPERPIPADATAVHGITDDDVAASPTFREALPEILESLRGAMPLAYNAEFDKEFLLEELRRAGETEAELPPAFQSDVTWVDPLTWARELQKEEKSRALGDVCERLGIQLDNAHRATNDARAAGQVLNVFLRDSRVPQTYGAFIREQRRLERLFEFQRARWRA